METGQLLQRFGSMQTEDRSESIKQMRKLVGGEHALSESKATFYLEMSNWNVHAAEAQLASMFWYGKGPFR